ncbi:TAXI family TRAP transporter solute-binding subunit [Pseudooceanicola sp. LIPI14-2-Ac024]|uniref:TAXI family TRAP transporter solute-binding subunit n=1 Tax=Pseudooceanicola sp. LIPI14-2-Ac024 TaxID=3344875 RepID=UPI0035CE8AA6
MTLRLSAALCAIALAAPAVAQEVKLPGQISWTAYDLGSAGYNQAVAIGSVLKSQYGTNLRVLPGKNDIARSEPLRQGKVDYSATGIGGTYMAQEGAFEYGAENWGPQAVRVLLANQGPIGLSVGVTRAACEKVGKPDCEGFTYADLKGLRVGEVRGAPALNVAMEAYLAYGGLTWDDVEVVEFGGYGDSWKALGSGQSDAAFAATNSGFSYEQETNPNGLFWPPIDANDTAAIERMQSVAPYFAPGHANVGAGLDGTDGIETAKYPYPILITMADKDAEEVYNLVKAMVEHFDEYDGDAPGIGGWALDLQNMSFVAPYHDGAIKYFKEAGVWTDEAQAHNDDLIARQEALAKAWEELKAEGPSDWAEAWAAKRKEALEAGGFKVVF